MPRPAPYVPYDLKGQVAFVTGATAGIGEATAWRLAELGCKLIISGRRQERLDALAKEMKEALGTEVKDLQLDMSDAPAVSQVATKLAGTPFENVDILINNAGLALGKDPVDANDHGNIAQMINTNVTGLMILTQVISAQMRARGKPAHIVNIGSIAGHEAYPGGSVYCASKFAVRAFTEAARNDLAATPVRVSSVSPGFVNTEFSTVRFGGDKSKADSVYADLVPLVAVDIADQITYIVTRPPHVQVGDIVVWPTNQGSATNIQRVGERLGAK